MIHKFIELDEKKYRWLKNNPYQFKNIFQYVYSRLYSEIYCSSERRGSDLKSTFHIAFKTYKEKKKHGTNT